jgi:flagellar P-ring protein precursor FlgI
MTAKIKPAIRPLGRLGWVVPLALAMPLTLNADGLPGLRADQVSGFGGGPAAPGADASRIKDLASVAGVRSNQLVGYGLVVGLDGTGDNPNDARFTSQSLLNMLTQLGIQLPPNTTLRPKNVAAVMVSAQLPPFAKLGQTIDVTVSSLGSASSLRGGTLIMTPLKGADGQVYAIAQGNLLVGGLGAQGADGSKITVNIPSAGRIPNGASVERTVASPFDDGSNVVLNLHTPDFTTANRMAEAVNRYFHASVAEAMDATSVKVSAPQDPGRRVGFVAQLENIRLEPGDAPARVIVNARTGTVVIGEHVVVKPAAVSHGNLVVTITENPTVSQPAPFSNGNTVVTPSSNIDINQRSHMFLIPSGISLEEIVRAVNQVGAAPGDLVAILEALRAAGALRAELDVI